MAMEGNRHAMILEYWVSLRDHRRAVAGNRTSDCIANACHPYS